MPSTGIIYYTDNRLDPEIDQLCRENLAGMGIPIVSVSLKPISLGKNIVLNLERGYFTMFRQIHLALEISTADIVYFCEHDVLYHPSHFELVPENDHTYYYNRNNWKLDWNTGRALYYNCEQVLGLYGYRALLLEHYRRRIVRVSLEGFSRKMGFEPGKHRLPVGVDNNPWEWRLSAYPNVDIRHGNNLTESRWSQDEFRSRRNCTGWLLSNNIPFWGTREEIVHGRAR